MTDAVPPRSQADDRAPDGSAVGADGDRSDRPTRVGRRTFVKGLGAAGAATVGLSVDNGFAQDAEAVVPLAVGAAAVGGSVALGWALREFEVVGSDPPPDGLTPGTLHQSIYDTARTRLSTNKSTIVDNGNILDGIEHNAYIEAKTAAIEALNAGKSQSDAQADAIAAIDAYQTTIETNLLSSWNEAVNEANAMYGQVDAMSELSISDVFGANHSTSYTTRDDGVSFALDAFSRTMPDGTNFPVHAVDIYIHYDKDGYSIEGQVNHFVSAFKTEPRNESGDGLTHISESEIFGAEVVDPDGNGDSQAWLNYQDWKAIYDELITKFTNVRDGIILWLDSVYDDVQSGDIEIGDLVTPRQRASMMGGETSENQAAADLVALNMPVNADNEATITLDSSGIELIGTFALTDPTDGPLAAGTTYDPSTFAGDVYFTADMSLAQGSLSGYNSVVDNGVVTLNSEPYESTELNLTNVDGESAYVDAGNFSATGNGTWTYDASGDFTNPSSDLASVSFVSTAGETQYETVLLDGSFTIESITNTETGESVNDIVFTQSEPQTDNNYITQDEWDQLQKQNEELIEKYEQSKSGGGLDLGGLDMFGVPGEIVALGAAAVAGYLTLNDN